MTTEIVVATEADGCTYIVDPKSKLELEESGQIRPSRIFLGEDNMKTEEFPSPLQRRSWLILVSILTGVPETDVLEKGFRVWCPATEKGWDHQDFQDDYLFS